MNLYAIIVAGGKGKRMKTVNCPKQFFVINELPVLMHSIKSFNNANLNIRIIVVLPSVYINQWKTLCKHYQFDIKHSIVEGGPERFHSVQNGLAKVNTEGIVAVHDGVRPLVSTKLIKKCFSLAIKYKNAVPSIMLNDSIREIDGVRNKIVDRNKYRIIQTPQCFHTDIIKKAYLQTYQASFTDDASVVEKSGVNINLIEGEEMNIKITHEHDLLIAKTLFRDKSLD